MAEHAAGPVPTGEPAVADDAGGGSADHELEEFRARWRSELRERQAAAAAVAVGGAPFGGERADDSVRESTARTLFLQGVSAEQHGLFYEATSYYRQAIKLVPDIEERLGNALPPRQDLNVSAETASNSATGIGRNTLEEHGDAGGDADLDLIQHFSNMRLQECSQCVCEPNLPQQAAHVSRLPAEVLLHILRWVVSTDLDLRSLEQFAQVCTGFYLLARDSEVWKAACCKVWGKRCRLLSAYTSWRDMYINEPHLLFNGCYISKMSYTRQGERGLDTFYRPFHLVEYYRYCRFFPDGAVLLYTSADDVAITVTKLRSRQPRLQGLLAGVYRVTTGHHIQCVLKRYKWQENPRARRRHGNIGTSANAADEEETFHLELAIKDKPGRKNGALHWESYAVGTRVRGTEVSSRFSLDPKDYPPMHFARVKSFTAESAAPLL